MKQIRTVTGNIEPHELGFTQPHEHLLISRGISSDIDAALCIDNLDKSIEEVLEYKKAGGGTIIDAQPGGCNRMAEGLVEISERTGVKIIATTGFHKHIFYCQNHWLFTQSKDVIRNLFVHELEVGMFTQLEKNINCEYISARAGIVKGANDSINLTPTYAKCFSAAAQAANLCETPFMVHIERGSDAISLLCDILSWGIKPHRIIFCHLDRVVMPIDFYKRFLDCGIFLEFDTIGRFKYHSDEDEAALIKELLDRGYEEQILCSLDTTRQRLKSYCNDAIGLTYLLTNFFPMLRQYGVTQRQLNKISGQNIQRAFA